MRDKILQFFEKLNFIFTIMLHLLKVHSEFALHPLATKVLLAVLHLSAAHLSPRKLTYKEKEFIKRFELESKNKI
jgi:hypothetical protein